MLEKCTQLAKVKFYECRRITGACCLEERSFSVAAQYAFWEEISFLRIFQNSLESGSTSRRFQNFSFSFRPLTYLHLPAHLSIMSSSSPRGQGGPEKSASEVQIRILKKRPLRFLRIPCLCGGKHRTSICPTEQTTTTTTTTNMVTPCGSTNFKI